MNILIQIIAFSVGFFLAYANGANDISKGIATLVGSGVSNYNRAVSWGILWTGIGGIAGAFLARAMVQTFGKGLLTPGVHASTSAALATIAGAALWVILATLKGLPVSTTHAVIGSITGVSSLAYGLGGVHWAAVGGKIVVPLLVSPVISLVLTCGVLRAWKMLAPNPATDCLCAELVQPAAVICDSGDVMASSSLMPKIHVTPCIAVKDAPVGITLNHLHWLISGATSFARGLNDAPKMVALVLGVTFLLEAGYGLTLRCFVVITAGMLVGSWRMGRRVTEVLAAKVTQMDHQEGFVANLVTAILVGSGAALGWPMSTTHVASGAIIGIAKTRNNPVNSKTIRDMLLAWAVTVPAAALLGIAAFALLRLAGMR